MEHKKMADYAYHYGLKVRIYPSQQQKEMIRRNADAARCVYNEHVAVNKEIARFGRRSIYIDFIEKRIEALRERIRTVTALKDRYPWLRHPDIDAQSIANARQNYQRAWRQFRAVHHAGVPNFHKKTSVESYQTNPHYSKGTEISLFTSNARFLDKHHLMLPKLKRIRFQGSRKILDRLFAMKEVRIGTITITKDSRHRYFASFQLGSDEPFVKTSPKTKAEIGIDLNVENFYADSNGEIVANPRYYRRQKRRLANAQRKLSRRIVRAKKEHRPLREAKNVEKQRLLVARLTAQVMQRRRDFLHRTSATLIKNHDLVAAEELRSRNLLKNHALAMSIQDNGWRMFLSMLTYKAALYGKNFVTVDPRNTTQSCHACGHIMSGKEKLTLKDREWICPKCGIHHIRDVNAAKNILARAKAKLVSMH